MFLSNHRGTSSIRQRTENLLAWHRALWNGNLHLNVGLWLLLLWLLRPQCLIEDLVDVLLWNVLLGL